MQLLKGGHHKHLVGNLLYEGKVLVLTCGTIQNSGALNFQEGGEGSSVAPNYTQHVDGRVIHSDSKSAATSIKQGPRNASLQVIKRGMQLSSEQALGPNFCPLRWLKTGSRSRQEETATAAKTLQDEEIGLHQVHVCDGIILPSATITSSASFCISLLYPK